jgi:hypothetical protein
VRHYGNSIAHYEIFHLSADRGDNARCLGAVGRRRRRLQGMIAAPVNQVGSIQADRLHTNLDVMRTGCYDRNCLDALNLCRSWFVEKDNPGHKSRNQRPGLNI